ncbi:MAG: beta-aspartyl-peptidase [Clostridium sp.]|jgi:beta-aspartyl-dipeptidase (metallo-type)|uniref:beta-aspartyl-peptidase n=1 Tax=Clostridium TaxID=1485 RepID=UPI000BE367D7|nr:MULTISPECIES: beta-aspartyl-peptidase [Clostridium]MBU6133983.1 beta-aspartyl-peptidase [Clostridium tertium]MDB1933808.1 beta-aspartyl-peptidase [Clostridium tertium]MDB1936675.1 beta-aspartyl-peptidase [Clostridium tertium]MDB1940540.1 beta-aspartyl-peptidase [Clostridium tertium]MDB1946291.1 beta-aspartyl-peptidase [Clostridium tertium]
MITVIKGIKVYSPEYKGVKDVVISSNKIEGIYEDLKIPTDFININVIDGKGKLLFPGFIDCHVHINGGGGEGGFRTRTPEIKLTDLTRAGITTVVGCIGTDGICRDMKSLIAKAKALEEEGITTFCYTGSYEIPVKTTTNNIKSDLMLIDKVIGVGEVALSDHRSSQATYTEFTQTVAQARVGGLLSGKAGIVNIHLGDGARNLGYLFSLIEETEIPATQLLPTHINRNEALFKAGEEYVKKGGFIDLTTSSDPNFLEPGELSASEGLKILLDDGIDISNVTFSSDGNGSMPIFDNEGKLVGLGICSVATLYEEVKECIKKYNIKIEDALKVITSNVSNVLKLTYKGTIADGKDADLVLVDENSLEIDTVIAMGKIMIQNGEPVVKGTFE